MTSHIIYSPICKHIYVLVLTFLNLGFWRLFLVHRLDNDKWHSLRGLVPVFLPWPGWYLLTQDGPAPGHENLVVVVPSGGSSCCPPSHPPYRLEVWETPPHHHYTTVTSHQHNARSHWDSLNTLYVKHEFNCTISISNQSLASSEAFSIPFYHTFNFHSNLESVKHL